MHRSDGCARRGKVRQPRAIATEGGGGHRACDIQLCRRGLADADVAEVAIVVVAKNISLCRELHLVIQRVLADRNKIPVAKFDQLRRPVGTTAADMQAVGVEFRARLQRAGHQRIAHRRDALVG